MAYKRQHSSGPSMTCILLMHTTLVLTNSWLLVHASRAPPLSSILSLTASSASTDPAGTTGSGSSSSPLPSPTAAPLFRCNICGDGFVMTMPDNVAVIVNGGLSCANLQTEGDKGSLNEAVCATFVDSEIPERCGCVEDDSPSSVANNSRMHPSMGDSSIRPGTNTGPISETGSPTLSPSNNGNIIDDNNDNDESTSNNNNDNNSNGESKDDTNEEPEAPPVSFPERYFIEQAVMVLRHAPPLLDVEVWQNVTSAFLLGQNEQLLTPDIIDVSISLTQQVVPARPTKRLGQQQQLQLEMDVSILRSIATTSVTSSVEDGNLFEPKEWFVEAFRQQQEDDLYSKTLRQSLPHWGAVDLVSVRVGDTVFVSPVDEPNGAVMDDTILAILLGIVITCTGIGVVLCWRWKAWKLKNERESRGPLPKNDSMSTSGSST